MRKTIAFTLLFILLSYIKVTLSIEPNLSFKKITVSDGLSERYIQAIIQDEQQNIWFATIDGITKYNGYKYSILPSQKIVRQLKSTNFTTLSFDQNNVLWSGTAKGQILQYNPKNDQETIIDLPTSDSVVSIAAFKNLYISTRNSVFILSRNQENTLESINLPAKGKFQTIKDTLYYVSPKGIYLLNNSSSFELVSKFSNDFIVNNVSNQDDLIWIATTKGAFSFDTTTHHINHVKHSVIANQNITDVLAQHSNTWFATEDKGVYLLNNSAINHFNSNKLIPDSLSDNNITTLFLDNSDNLWLGTFNYGANKSTPKQVNFGNHKNLPQNCFGKGIIYNFFNNNGRTLIASSNGLVEVSDKVCQKLPLINHLNYSAYSILKDNESIYIGTNKGLATISNGALRLIALENNPQEHIYFIESTEDNIIFGTYAGLYNYKPTLNTIEKITTSSDTKTKYHSFHSVATLNNHIFYATNEGLYKSDKLLLNIEKINNPSINSSEINYILSHNNKLLMAMDKGPLLFLDQELGLVEAFQLPVNNVSVLAINVDSNNNLWISSNRGLFRVNIKKKAIKHFREADGLQSDVFVRGATYRAPDGKLYFGGRNGFNAFYPEDIQDNLVPPKVVLTELRRFNKVVEPDMMPEAVEAMDGFKIDTPIEYLDELVIGHRDYVISLEFAGLHYADPMRNQYQYKLEGLHQDWIETDASNRVATFTNLAPGDYVFRVRAANKDGIWSLPEDEVALSIRVNPAPWLSWWAYTLYTLFIVGTILWFIRYRTQAAVKRSRELEQEVAARTKEIHTQKEVIEGLLERKNELFANISHEFRTPLTLILGPLEKELKALDSPKNPKHLAMIQRNAKRLLGMVEQILKLTELKKEETLAKLPHAVNPALEAIVESFKPLAESKQIKLTLDTDDNCNVLVSNDAQEVMLGNLISNAIKYTPQGGQVSITSKILQDNVQLSVTDTGVGITPEQQHDIFERFVRLDKTSDIAGTGIGLSIVKELVASHHGTIQVNSQEQQGSTFTLTLPTTEQAATNDSITLQSISHLVSTEPQHPRHTAPDNLEQDNHDQDTLLIIEDNPDMHDYIEQVLSSEYRCLTANRGQAGINIAIEQVPDLIICDIMMPGLNGYEVARQLRDDTITSHIPIVLLTAKGDKLSRIQGWNENIDDYMTKPFDEQELKTRISNILSIRNILRRKAGQELTQHTGQTQPLANTGQDDNTVLPVASQQEQTEANPQRTLNKKEQAFVDKLMQVIEDNYSNPDFQRKDMAALMFLSERQLHRKIKALLNQNTVEILREYRLRQSKSFIMDGEQITIVAEKCGFNSISHFSQTFKAFYGVSPSESIK